MATLKPGAKVMWKKVACYDADLPRKRVIVAIKALLREVNHKRFHIFRKYLYFSSQVHLESQPYISDTGAELKYFFLTLTDHQISPLILPSKQIMLGIFFAKIKLNVIFHSTSLQKSNGTQEQEALWHSSL